MIRTFVVILFVFLIGSAFRLNTETGQDRALFLTGSTQKVWYLHSVSPPLSGAADSSVKADNTYIFFADGKFEFDHGAITEDPACEGDNCFSDFVNLVGTWKFTNSQKGLQVVALHEKGNPGNGTKTVILNGSIQQLDEDVLKVSQKDQSKNINFVFEFRKK
jgi:hypothetical protein